VSQFLSADWCGEMTALLQGSDEFRKASGNVELTVQQVVEAVPPGDTIRYYLRINKGDATVALGDAPSPGADVTVAQDYATACEIAKGDLNMQNAFMSGRIRVTGDMGKVMAHQASLASMESLRDQLEVEYGGAETQD